MLLCVSAADGPNWREMKRFQYCGDSRTTVLCAQDKILTRSPPVSHTSGPCLLCQYAGRQRCSRTSTPLCRCTAWPWIYHCFRTLDRRCRRCPRRRSPQAFLRPCGCSGHFWLDTSLPSSGNTWGSLRSETHKVTSKTTRWRSHGGSRPILTFITIQNLFGIFIDQEVTWAWISIAGGPLHGSTCTWAENGRIFFPPKQVKTMSAISQEVNTSNMQ